MQPIFRDFLIWVLQFLSISCGLLVAVHLIRRSLTQPAPATADKTSATNQV